MTNDSHPTVKTTHPDNKTETVDFDANANETKRCDTAGRCVVNVYDALASLISSRQPGKSAANNERDKRNKGSC